MIIQYIEAFRKRIQERRDKKAGAFRTYARLAKKSHDLAIEGKYLTSAESAKIVDAAEEAGVSPEQMQKDRDLLYEYVALRQVADELPSHQAALAALKLTAKEIAPEATRIEVIQRRRAHAVEFKALCAEHLEAKQALAAMQQLPEINTLLLAECEARERDLLQKRRSFESTKETEIQMFEKSREREREVNGAERGDLVLSINKATNAGERARQIELDNHVLFDAPTPEEVKAAADAEARKRHLMQSIEGGGDPNNAKYPVIIFELAINRKYDPANYSEFEFLPLPGQAPGELNVLVDILIRETVAGGRQRRGCYLKPEKQKLPQHDWHFTDLVKHIEQIEDRPIDPNDYTVLPFCGQTDRERESLIARWRKAWEKRQADLGNDEFARSRHDQNSGVLVR